MADHPIQGLMKTVMESLKDMVDVNTVVGDPVEGPDGTVIMPVSRVSFGFAAGGGEYSVGEGEAGGLAEGRRGTTARGGGGGRGGEGRGDDGDDGGGGEGRRSGEGGGLPFGGGSGGGVTVQPVAFLVVGQSTVRLLSVDGTAVFDRLIDLVPQVLDRLRGRAAAPAGPGGA